MKNPTKTSRQQHHLFQLTAELTPTECLQTAKRLLAEKNYQEAVNYLKLALQQQASKTTPQPQDNVVRTETILALANCYALNLCQPSKAIQLLLVETRHASNNYTTHQNALLLYHLALYLNRDPKTQLLAQQYLQKALAILENENNPQHKLDHVKLQAYCFFELAIALANRQPQNAVPYYELSLTKWNELLVLLHAQAPNCPDITDCFKQCAINHFELARCYKKLASPDAMDLAIKHTQKSLTLYQEKCNDPVALHRCHIELGVSFATRRDYQQASGHLMTAYTYFSENPQLLCPTLIALPIIDNNKHLLNLYLYTAIAMLHTGQPQQALPILQQSESWCANQSTYHQHRHQFGIALCYLALRDYNKAENIFASLLHFYQTSGEDTFSTEKIRQDIGIWLNTESPFTQSSLPFNCSSSLAAILDALFTRQKINTPVNY